MSDPRTTIVVRGAREHNLKNISVELPKEKLIVFTGLSGSGKSSLAFDTIYAEGQRRYVESLSAYARQFLEMMGKPDVDAIEGLSPAISIEQKTTSRNPRSTVGTVTEIHDYMRLLFARVGVPHSPATGLPIESQTVSQMVDRLLELPERTRLYLLAPVVRGRKGEYRKEFAEWLRAGFQRVKVDGQFYHLEEPPELKKNVKHDIEVVVDRLVIRPGIATRLADSLQTALQLADGLAIAEFADEVDENGQPRRIVFSEKFACPVSGFTIEELEPRLFSFNNPAGACPSCDGLGTQLAFEPDLVVPDPNLSLSEGAIAPWSRNGGAGGRFARIALNALCRSFGVSMRTPWKDLPEDFRHIVLYGTGGPVEMEFATGRTMQRNFPGVIPHLERRWRETDSNWLREELSQYLSDKPCEACGGFRLKPEALAVKIAGLHIGEVSRMSIRAAHEWFADIEKTLSPARREIARRILKEIRERLKFLIDVGLDYLTLDRKSGTLSGGESQRIRLASQIGSGLTGVLYVLDEPSIGLHQRDNDRLLATLTRLRDLGNTVIVVEHDEDTIRAADHVLDIGPGAGVHGGEIVAQGTPADIEAAPGSLTGQYLSGQLRIEVPRRRRPVNRQRMLRLVGASGHNLKNITAEIPLGTFTCITGVSGSGKSTLTVDTLYAALARELMGSRARPAPYERIEGLEHLDKIIDIDQSPIGRTPRSNPATYTGAFTPIREWFAGLPEAKARGYGPGRFSFNVKGGRCEACKGDGVIKIEMHFLPDVFVTCEQCGGQRYNRETLEITWKDKSIADVLDMTVEEATEFFSAVPAVRNKLELLQRVGLGYMKLGQPATTLSGGEAQRVKLSRELSKRATGRTLYILDEPTTGLHFHDVARLLDVLHQLVEQGNTVVVIEHNLDVIKTADWIIDLGPEGGDAGGEIVIAGTPEDVAACEKSWTGRYLKRLLAPARSGRTAAE